jgi:hypothetical protein
MLVTLAVTLNALILVIAFRAVRAVRTISHSGPGSMRSDSDEAAFLQFHLARRMLLNSNVRG